MSPVTSATFAVGTLLDSMAPFWRVTEPPQRNLPMDSLMGSEGMHPPHGRPTGYTQCMIFPKQSRVYDNFVTALRGPSHEWLCLGNLQIGVKGHYQCTMDSAPSNQVFLLQNHD